MLLHVTGLTQVPGKPPWRGHPAGWHPAAVARIPELAGELVRAAIVADRRAGASWAEIGRGLGISTEAARARFGRTRHPVRSGRSER